MKLRILALLIGLILLLSACAAEELPDETDSGSESSSESGSDLNDAEDPTPSDDGGIKTLTDTDTPDKSMKLSLTYDSFDKLGLKYATGALGSLYDGDINSRLSYYTPEASTTYNVAKLDGKNFIEYIKLFCAAEYERNIGVELQASADGIEYITLYTLTAEDVEVMKNAPLVIEISNSTEFGYFRIYHEESTGGYDLNEVELYGYGRVYEKVNVSYLDFGDGNGGKNLGCVYGTNEYKGKEDGIKLIWDGVTDTTYCNYFPGNSGSWTSAKLPETMVIGKLVLATIWEPAHNIGTAIQASVDGTNWTTLYTLSSEDGSFIEGTSEWKLETLEIIVTDTTAYNYVRVYDTAGQGYCLAEVEVFKVVEPMDVDTEKYPKTTVALNNSVAGVQILGERNLASNDCINADWSCSGIEITLNCAGNVSFEVSSDKPCYFRVYVDGVAKYNGGSLYYTVDGDTTVTLRNLPEGEHTIRLIKVTGWTLANAQIKSVTFNGTMADTAPAGNDYYIEFVGDSITCAWGTIGPGGGSYEGQDGTLAYSYILAEKQNADYSMTALSGQGLLCGTPNVTVGYEYASWKKDSANKYDFARQADMVVINIGTNDFYQKDDLGIDADDFKAAYKSFLEMVKAKNGDDCKILCVYNCMNDNFGSEIETLCREMGGPDAGYYCQKLERAKSHSNGSGHPTAAEEAAYADVLDTIITAIRNGTYTVPKQYEKVTATYQGFGDGNGGQRLDCAYGDSSLKFTEDVIKAVWDGNADTVYCNYLPGNVGSWTSASFASGTVIGKLELTTIYNPAANIGTAIQASVDGTNWTTLYTISEADSGFVVKAGGWVLQSLEITVTDTTAYNYIRVYDTTGSGYCLSEVAVYVDVTPA